MKLKKIIKIESKSKRYDIQTESKNFFANRILIHNSLLIISKYLGNFIIRTRGTIDATKMENGHEIEVFKNTILYPKLHNVTFVHWASFDTWPCSVLFEWYSPQHRIVVKYDDSPQWYLIGVVNHDDYTLWDQQTLDKKASDLGLSRPTTYNFNNILVLIELVKKWEGKEGVVVYTKKDQVLHKVKSDWYLLRHRLKEEFGSIEKIVDFFISEKCPDYNTFTERIAYVVDWETANECKSDISKICDAWKEVNKITDGMRNFVEPLKSVSRKDAALKILSSYGKTNRSQFCFSVLDSHSLTDNQLKKLLWQSLKNS